MSPAASLAWIVVAASASWLTATTMVPAMLRLFDGPLRRVQPLSTPMTIVLTAVFLASLMRPSIARAATPPPAARITAIVGPSASSEIAPSVVVGRPLVARRSTAYTVVRGDSLWKIARSVLESRRVATTGNQITNLWKAIYEANRDVIGRDPNLILPGQELTIPGGSRG